MSFDEEKREVFEAIAQEKLRKICFELEEYCEQLLEESQRWNWIACQNR